MFPQIVDMWGMTIAVLIPCYNEEGAIAQVVREFRIAVPEAAIYVYDNNSTDRTIEVARAEGAVVRSERRQGKGNVVRRMFADIEADIYVLVDGDATYHAASAPAMIELLRTENLDMVVGTRLGTDDPEAFRAGHHFGNRLLTGIVAWLFGGGFSDMLSGYRVFSRRFVKTFPALADGFETETELTVHAASLDMPVAEVETPYFSRPEGTQSKLRTYSDGFNILIAAFKLAKDERPIFVFGMGFLALALISLGLAVPIVITFMETGLVPRIPTALLATGTMLLAFLSLAAGIILDGVSSARRELKRLAYLRYSAPGSLR